MEHNKVKETAYEDGQVYAYAMGGGIEPKLKSWPNEMKSTIDKSTFKRSTNFQDIEVLVKCLGTMILMPEFEQDPMNLGSKKQFVGNTQMPILMDRNREIALNKLVELIESL